MKVVMWVCLLPISFTVITGCRDNGSAPQVLPQTIQAQLVQSQQLEQPLQLSATGTVHAKDTAVISAQVMGRIQQVLVREGDSVHAGQTLVVLDGSALHASLEQTHADVIAAQSSQAAAQANAALAASTLARYKQLESQKSVSLQEIDEVSRRAEAANANADAQRAQADSARARESETRTMLGYTRLVAPFAGVVTSRMADPGTMASPGVPILQLDKAGPLQLNVSVDESAIGAIHKGMHAPVTGNAVSTAIVGIVAQILPAADPSSRSFIVKIDLPASAWLRAGMYAAASFATGQKQTTVIPRSAVVTRGSLTCVYTLDSQGMAQLRYVTLGSQQGNLVEVLSGIAVGEKLVASPSDRELAGKRVTDSKDGARQ